VAELFVISMPIFSLLIPTWKVLKSWPSSFH